MIVRASLSWSWTCFGEASMRLVRCCLIWVFSSSAMGTRASLKGLSSLGSCGCG